MIMRRFHCAALAAVTAFGFAAVASAADIPVKAPVYKAAPIPYSWTGFYLGVNAGYGVGRELTTSAISFPGAVALQPQSVVQPQGAFGGVQAGYNWQFGDWLLGVETDIQADGQSDSRTCILLCIPGLGLAVDQKLTWFGTTRARLGWVTGPVMTYVTGGAAYGGTKTAAVLTVGPFTSAPSVSSTRSGWALGSGVEAALDGNWTAKAEYLFIDLGSSSLPFTAPFTGTLDTQYREHLFRAGLNYRLGGGGATAMSVPTVNWTGFYVGGNLGWGIARNPSSLALGPGAVSAESFDIGPRGFLGGVLAGYNWQTGRWVIGGEADFQVSGLRDSDNCILVCAATVAAATVEQKLQQFGTVRGRLGYAAGPALFYATGGLAYGKFTSTINEFILVPPLVAGTFSFSHTKAGWTAGGGIERQFDFFGMLGRNWTARTEYLYVDLGNATDNYVLAGLTHTYASSMRAHIWRSALSYKY